MDESSLIVGRYTAKPLYAQICEEVSPRFIFAMEKLNNYNIIPDNVMINLHFPEESNQDGNIEEKEAMVFVKSFKTTQNATFNIITLARNKNTFKLSEKYLPELATHLSELIQTINS
jgi:hypothetical protein